MITESALEARARRAAHRLRLVAKKSTWRRGTIDNHGRFMLIDAYRNAVVAGERFDLSAEEVIEYCKQ
jgi:hypothetical protein